MAAEDYEKEHSDRSKVYPPPHPLSPSERLKRQCEVLTARAFDHVACQPSVDWWGVWPGSRLIKGHIRREGGKKIVTNQHFQRTACQK